MKTKLSISIGGAVGTVIYQSIRHGFQHIDWLQVATVAALTFLLILFIPARVFERKKTLS